MEGYLFPATYSFTEEKPPLEEMIETMIAKTEEILAKYTEDMEARGMTVHQLLTMASLIEEEATEKADREKLLVCFTIDWKRNAASNGPNGFICARKA